MAAISLDRLELEEAFRAFNEHSGRLERSYRDLERKVEVLTGRLRESQSARLAELEAKEALSTRLRNLLESLPGAIIVLDADGIVRECNSEAVRLLNRPLTGLSWAAIVRREVATGGTEDGHLRLGDGRWLSLSRRPLAGEQAEVLLLADVTDSRHMSALRQREERLTAIGEMTAQFAHDVRTPLASAMLYAAQLDTGPPAQRRAAGKVIERLNDLGRMVNDMLGFAAGARASAEPVRISELLAAVAAQVGTGADDPVRLTIEPAPARLVVAGNQDALRNAVLNLVNNGLEACGARGAVSVSARATDDDRVEVLVADDGPGIPAEVMPRLFEPFFTTRPQGTGLGLAVVQTVALAHGGEVRVTSRPGATEFVLSLPAAPARQGGASDA